MPSILAQDRCWTIPVVAAGCAFICLLTATSSGLMYILFMKEFDISHEQATWPLSTFVVMGQCAGLLLSVLQRKMTIYHITLISAVLTSTGLIISAFAPDIIWRTVLLGVMHGAGIGMLMTSLSVYTLLYFKEYRATATAFKYTGWAMSGIVGPSLMGYLAENYGYNAPLLLAGGISANAIPLLMLLKIPRPVDLPTFCREKKVSVAAVLDQTGAPFQSAKAVTLSLFAITNANVCRNSVNEEARETSDNLRRHSFTETDVQSIVGRVPPVTNQIENEDTPQTPVKDRSLPDHPRVKRCKEDRPCGEALVVNAPSFLTHCGALLRSGMFYAFIASFVMIDYVTTMYETTIVEYGVDKNVATLKQCYQLQTFNAAGQLLGRLVMPFLSDKISLNRCAFTPIILTIAAACFVLAAVADHYVTLALVTTTIGVCDGYVLCIKVVLMGEHFGVESLDLCCGFEGICMIPAALSAPALIGFFRDKLGSYDRFYWMLGAMKLLPAFLVGGMAVADRLHQKTWIINHTSKL